MMNEAMTNFSVKFTLDGRNFEFYANNINRNTTDGGGNPIYYAKCYELGKRGQVIRTGVVNLTADWKVKSLFI